MTPVVSIITPTFNASSTIGQAIQSVQAQTFRCWEMLVIDDKSTDDTCAIVEGYTASDKRIQLLRQLVNGGPAHARNMGLKVAGGRYIAFLDSDDYWLPEKLDRQLAFMTTNKVALSYTLYRRFKDDITHAGPLVTLPQSFTYDELLKNTGIGCLTAMVDRDLTGPFEFPLIHHEDYALWLRILKKGVTAQGLMDDLARYRVSNTSVSGNKLQSAGWVWTLYRDIEKLFLPYATWCFANYAWNAYRRNRQCQ